MPPNVIPASLAEVLRHIDETRPLNQAQWRGSTIQRIGGGANNLVYRIRHDSRDLAVKFTIRDARNRARREFQSLRALQSAGLTIAPVALWLDEESYRQPVVVQTWLSGEPFAAAPTTTAEWRCLLAHYRAVHSLTIPVTSSLEPAVLNFRNSQHGKQEVLAGAARIPPAARPPALAEILRWFDRWTPPFLSDAPRALCRVDANWRNFIRQVGQCVSVDWENSGWGDPAFEIAELMTHPAYDAVDPATWEWVIHTYADLVREPGCAMRIRTYHVQMRVWWAIRWARYLYEIPRGMDERLAPWPDDWQEHAEQKLHEAIETFHAVIAEL